MEGSKVIIPLLGGWLDITGEVVTEWIILAVVLVLSLLVRRNLSERPGKLQNLLETGIEALDGFFGNILGAKRCRKYYYFLSSMFVFIIFSNYCGLVPGVGLTDYVKAPTSSLSVTAGLSICTFVFLQAASIRSFGFKGYLKRFVSPIAFMLPLLILDEFIKPLSLALRQFGNIFGEETVMEEMYHIFPIGLPLVMMVLSLLFCAIQAVVFTMLTAIYLEEATAELE